VKKLNAALACFAFGISAAVAQEAKSQAAISPEDSVVRTEEQWLRACNEKDRKTAAELTSDDFMATTPIGEVLGKSKLIPPDRPVQGLPKLRIVTPVTHIFEDVAVVMAKLDDEQGGRLATTAAFKRYDGHWKMIAIQMTPAPQK
jgi:hypothetical protein